MKRSLIVKGFAFVFAFSFLSFQKIPPNVSNTIEEIEFSVFIPCANGGLGEEVLISGRLHVLTTYTMNANNISGIIHIQNMGLKGTGLHTGTQYNVTGGTQYRFSGPVRNGAYVDRFVNNFRIIGPKTGNNLLIHSSGHITINANGDMTVVTESFTEECR